MEGRMKRTTVMIPTELKSRAAKHAKRKGMSLGGLIRESLERELEIDNHRANRDADDPFFCDDSVFSGESPADLSVNHDEYLYEIDEDRTQGGNRP
jgi:hypothetical protein